MEKRWEHKDLVQVIIEYDNKTKWQVAPIDSISPAAWYWFDVDMKYNACKAYNKGMAEWLVDKDQLFWLHSPKTLPKGSKIVSLIHVMIPESSRVDCTCYLAKGTTSL